MKKILITGGCGFLGSHLADELLKQEQYENCETIIIDDLTTGRIGNIPKHKNIRFIQGSIGCTAFTRAVFQSFKDIDYVFHFAASYKDPSAHHQDLITNGIGTINVVNCCKEFNVKKIIYLQTALMFGLRPLTNPIQTNHPLFSAGFEAGSSYAASKTVGLQYIELSKISHTCFILCNMFGERNTSGAIPNFVRIILNGSKEPIIINDTKRDFLYYKNLMPLLIKSISTHEGKLGNYFVSSSSDYSIKEIFLKLIEIIDIEAPKNVEYRPRGEDDVATIMLDNSKTRQDYDWKPEFLDLNINLLNTYRWYKENGIDNAYTHLKMK